MKNDNDDNDNADDNGQNYNNKKETITTTKIMIMINSMWYRLNLPNLLLAASGALPLSIGSHAKSGRDPRSSSSCLLAVVGGDIVKHLLAAPLADTTRISCESHDHTSPSTNGKR